jgi:hypothetical protein
LISTIFHALDLRGCVLHWPLNGPCLSINYHSSLPPVKMTIYIADDWKTVGIVRFELEIQVLVAQNQVFII